MHTDPSSLCVYIYIYMYIYICIGIQYVCRYMFLTDDREHAGGLGGSGVTFVLGLVVKHRLVHDEGPLDPLSEDLVLLSFPDLVSVFEPADLSKRKTRFIVQTLLKPCGGRAACRLVGGSHLGGFAGHFTFKLSRFFLFDLDVRQRLRELHMRS